MTTKPPHVMEEASGGPEPLLGRWERLQTLKQRVSRLNLDLAIDAAEKEAEMRDMVRQMEQEYNVTPGSLLAQVQAQAEALDAEALEAGLLEGIDSEEQQLQSSVQQRFHRLYRRLMPASANEPAAERAAPAWLPALKWTGALLFLLLVGLAIFWPGAGLLWLRLGLVVVGLLLALGLAGVAERLARQPGQRRASRNSRHTLTSPTAGDLQETDGLVRQQVANELQHVATILRETRRHIYRPADPASEQQALRLKQTAEQADNLAYQARQPGHGTPFYLHYPAGSWQQVAALLDEDEQLLHQAAAISAAAHEVNQAAISGQRDLSELNTHLALDLDRLHAAFAARSRMSRD